MLITFPVILRPSISTELPDETNVKGAFEGAAIVAPIIDKSPIDTLAKDNVPDPFGTQPSYFAKVADIVVARHVAMFLCRELTQNSLVHIGSHFGKRDHATVIHACKTVETRIAQDSHLNKLVETISTQLQ